MLPRLHDHRWCRWSRSVIRRKLRSPSGEPCRCFTRPPYRLTPVALISSADTMSDEGQFESSQDLSSSLATSSDDDTADRRTLACGGPSLGTPVTCHLGFPLWFPCQAYIPFPRHFQQHTGSSEVQGTQILTGNSASQTGTDSGPRKRRRGISLFHSRGLWEAFLWWRPQGSQKGKQLHLGTYLSEESAAKARDCALLFLRQWAGARGIHVKGYSASHLNFQPSTYDSLINMLLVEAQFFHISDFDSVVKFVRERLRNVYRN